MNPFSGLWRKDLHNQYRFDVRRSVTNILLMLVAPLALAQERAPKPLSFADTPRSGPVFCGSGKRDDRQWAGTLHNACGG